MFNNINLHLTSMSKVSKEVYVGVTMNKHELAKRLMIGKRLIVLMLFYKYLILNNILCWGE